MVVAMGHESSGSREALLTGTERPLWLAGSSRAVSLLHQPIAAPRKLSRKTVRIMFLCGGVVFLVSVMVFIRLQMPPALRVVPDTIARAVTFDVYYPEQQKLPAGYVLDAASFSMPVKDGVAYTIIYGDGKRIVFSVQPKPSGTAVQAFAANNLTSSVDYQTPVGLAKIGTYQGKTVVSLPVLYGPWIIVTAPQDIRQADLKRVLQSLHP